MPARSGDGGEASEAALLLSLLPVTATGIGLVVLAQVPSAGEVAGVMLVVAGLALHRERSAA